MISQSYRYFTSLVGSSISPEERAQALVKRALSCPAIKELYESAISIIKPNDNWISFVDRKSSPHLITGSYFACDRQKIYLAKDLTHDQALSSFTFELINVLSLNRFNQLYEEATKQTIACESYVKQIEEIEYRGIERHHQIMQKAIQEMGWNHRLDEYRKYIVKDFETAWHSWIRFSSHAEHYRMQWSSRSKQGYKKVTFKDELDSSIWLMTHLTTRDLLKESIQGGCVGGVSSVGITTLLWKNLPLVPIKGGIVSVAYPGVVGGAIGAIAARILSPFLTHQNPDHVFLGYLMTVMTAGVVGGILAPSGVVGGVIGGVGGIIAHVISER